MTLMKEKLTEALAGNINTYVWKGPKVNGIQEEFKLIDSSFEQLQKYYNHCNEMLYNTNSKNPGRLVLLDIVQEQIQKCRAELLIRWLRSEKQCTASACLEAIRTIIKNNKETHTPEFIKTCPVNTIMSGLPMDLEQVPISHVMDACLDSLGIFDNTHLTLNFIVKMGLWFTPQEMQKDLYEKDPTTGKAVNRLELVTKLLNINPAIRLRINNETGLSFNEFRAMTKLRKDKYVNLTSEQLRILSSKILYRFQDQCEDQAKQWQDKIEEILEVAKHKGWDVTRNID